MNKTKNRPDNWNVLPINLVCNVNPRIIRNNSQNNLDVSFIPMAAIDEEFGEIKKFETKKFQDVSKGFTYFEENDVLFAKITPCMENGKIAIARNLENRIGFGSTEFHVLRCGESIIPEYLFYFIRQKSFRRYAESFFSGSAGQQRVPSDFFKRVSIPLPPLAEQKQIVAILQEADALRRKQKEILEKSNRLASALFLKMFGDYKSNPKGFKKGYIRNLVSEVKYGTSKQASNEGKFKYLRMNNITYDGHWDVSDLKYIDLDKSELDKYSVSKGDIIFNRTNSKELVGKTAVYNFDELMVIAGYLIRIRTNQENNPWFIWGFLNSKEGKKYLLGLCKNIVGMANITQISNEIKSCTNKTL